MSQFFKPLLLLGLAGFLYQRLADKTILFYINARFVWLIWLAVGVLLLIALSYAIQRRNAKHTPAGHTLSWLTASLVLLPVLLGWLIPARPLGTAALLNRELSPTAPQSFTPAPPSAASVEEGAETLLDWMVRLGAHPDPEKFVGERADVIGFVYRRPNLPPDEWLLSRFLIWCCVADAVPISLQVRAPGVAVENDMWVQVQGTFIAETQNGVLVPVLLATRVIPITPPAQPYLYER